jgi:hypothetical protein
MPMNAIIELVEVDAAALSKMLRDSVESRCRLRDGAGGQG